MIVREDLLLRKILRFLQSGPKIHFCGFCKCMNFFHTKNCPAPQIYKNLGVKAEVKWLDY